MKSKLWLVVVVAIAIAIGAVSCAGATGGAAIEVNGSRFPGLSEQVSNSPASVNPASGTAKVKSVQWTKNGVNQGNLVFSFDGLYNSAVIHATVYDTLSFKVKSSYAGSGKGYGAFMWDDLNPYYVESWSLTSGITTTKSLARSYYITENTDFYVVASPAGSSLGSGPGSDVRAIYVLVP